MQIANINSESDQELFAYREDCEKYVLSISLLWPEKIPIISAIVDVKDFIDPAIKKLYDLVSMMESAGEPISPQSVLLSVKRCGMLEELGGAAGYAKLVNHAPTGVHAAFYASEVARLSMSGRLRWLARKLMESASLKSCDPAKALMEFESQAKWATAALGKSAKHIHDVVDEILADSRSKAKPTSGKCIPTGYRALDRMIGGYYTGGLTLLGGRFGRGKSGFSAESLAYGAAKGNKALVFSLEMTEREFVQRILSSQAGVSMNAWQRELDMVEDKNIEGFAERRPSFMWRIDPSSRHTARTIKSACQLMKARDGLDLIVIDNLQLMGDDDRRPPKNERVKNRTEELKRVAKELDIAIILLCQLNAEAASGRPTSTSWASSKEIEGDSDTALILHRVEEDSMKYEVIVTKNRSRGTTGSVPFVFDGEYQMFQDPAVSDPAISVNCAY
jgi:replicative DNA helicase